MGAVTEYSATPIISTRGLNRWDAQQGVGLPGEVQKYWFIRR